jgi:hypothetical protein
MLQRIYGASLGAIIGGMLRTTGKMEQYKKFLTKRVFPKTSVFGKY